MAEWLKAIILGVVEGVTEFLPISSTGHLIVTSSLLDFQSDLRLTFDIFIQIGAMFAVLAVYFPELRRQATVVHCDRAVQHLWRNLFIAFLPLVATGFFLKDWIKAVLFSPWVVALSLLVGGIIMILVERFWVPRQRITTSTLQGVMLRQAVVIGMIQTAALVPGVSRSAASIIGGMLTGLGRTTATEFSFLLAIPTLAAATMGELITSLHAIQPADAGVLFIGTVVSALVGWAAVRWLLRYVARHDFVAFGYYRIGAGFLIFLLIWLGWIPASL